MKNTLLFLLLLFAGCSDPVTPTVSPAAPTITVVSIYANDAIDATVEYTINGAFTATYLMVDTARIDVVKCDTLFIGTFPHHATPRSIVATYTGGTASRPF